MEIWKSITRYKGRYEISSLGRIRNNSGKLLKFFVEPKGHCGVPILYKGIRKKEWIHRLVAEEFLDNSENKPYVCHRDGNAKNNDVKNLYWGTSKENASDRKKHNTEIYGERNGRALLNIEKVKLSKLLYAKFGWDVCKISKLFNVSSSTISDIMHKRTWNFLN